MGLMPALTRPGTRPLVGVDIGASAIKLVELAGAEQQPELAAFAVAPLPEGAVADRRIVDAAALAEALRETMQRAGCSTRRVALAMPGAQVISRIVQLPASMTEEDMEQRIHARAEQYIPYPVNDVRLDFEVIGPSASHSHCVDVLLAACRREPVERAVEMLDRAGAKPAVIDAEPFALQNACRFLRHQMPDGGRGRTVAVADIGTLDARIHILHDQESVFSQAHVIGGSPRDSRDALLRPFLDELAQQIDRAFQVFFSSARAGGRVDRLLIAGGSAYLPGVEQHLSQWLEIPVQCARPLSPLAGQRERAQLESREAALLIALGLATRSFDRRR